MNIKTKFTQSMSKHGSSVKILTVAFILLFLGLSLVVINESAKVTTFEECESAGWLVRSITVYDYPEYVPNAIDMECALWTGKSFVKLNEINESILNGKLVNISSVTPFFLTQEKPATTVMHALSSNKPEELKLVDGCFRVDDGTNDLMIIWPYGFSFNTDENGVIKINNESGQPIMKIGDKVQFGGGEMSGGDSGDVTKYSEKLPSRCKGPYWIVGEIVFIEKNTM